MSEEYRKVLIIRTGAIGDVVHTTNLVHSIKKAYPLTEIHYMAKELVAFIPENDKDIKKTIIIDPRFKLFSKYTFNLAKELKKEKYDLAINLQPSLKIRCLVHLAGIKKEIVYKKDFKLHAVTNFWKTGLKAFPDMEEDDKIKIYLPQQSVDKAKEILQSYKRPFVIINAGGVFAKRQGRTYPVSKWVELGNKIQEKYDGTVILTGEEKDREFLKPLNEINNSVNLIGKLSLEDSCGIISQADLMLSGDSGPLHIATALDIKSIGLYGSMPVNRTGCYCNGINIKSAKSCSPCNKRKCKFLKKTKNIYAPCMEEIDVLSVFEEVQKILNQL